MNKDNNKHCKACKHYKRCNKNIYAANIERRYLILWSNKDCWVSNG